MWQSCVEIKGFIRHSCIYEVHMSPALNRSSAIWRFERSNAIEIHDRRFLHGTAIHVCVEGEDVHEAVLCSMCRNDKQLILS